MGDHPNEDLIQLLYGADGTEPAVAAVLESDGAPRVSVQTGHTDSAVESQLTLIAAYVKWLADRSDVDPERVADDAMEIVDEMRASDEVYVDTQLYEQYVGDDGE